ncbi:MAG: hypothetical protein PW843_06295 [Azospirillaceae bacterium]|nr:hypothetical protein [Azospirillaceae bacterium]
MKMLTGVAVAALLFLSGNALAAEGGSTGLPVPNSTFSPVTTYTPLNFPNSIGIRAPEPTGITDATKSRLTNVAQRVDALIDQHKCDEAGALAKEQGGAKMADMATKICALRYAAAQ